MLQYIDKAWREADKALGGVLPGGGTAGPLSGVARTISESVPIIDMVSPASANYYRDKVEADRQRGERLITESQDAVRSINVDDGLDSNEINTSQDAARRNTEATLRGVVLAGDGTMISTREDGQSDRDFYLQNRLFRESDRAADIAVNVRDDAIYNDAERIDKVNEAAHQRAQKRAQSTTQGVGWIKSINNAAGMSTADGPDSGALGCVYGVNKVIKSAGLEVPWKDPATGQESVYIPFVTNWITSNGGSQVSTDQAKPGDIVVANGGGHMGILTDKVDGNGDPVVLSNSSSRASMSWEFALMKQMDVYRVPQLQR